MHEERCSSRGSLLLKQSWVLVQPWLRLFLQTHENHRQSDLNHHFVMFLFAQKLRTMLNFVMMMIKTEGVC